MFLTRLITFLALGKKGTGFIFCTIYLLFPAQEGL